MLVAVACGVLACEKRRPRRRMGGLRNLLTRRFFSRAAWKKKNVERMFRDERRCLRGDSALCLVHCQCDHLAAIVGGLSVTSFYHVVLATPPGDGSASHLADEQKKAIPSFAVAVFYPTWFAGRW
mmetsp:Transcript_43963/g.104046  ORF Transcript_43963/g.104046 Transcript_43963/m.104046 type:complete len:125 (-) Transcript_43963:194-568(-)